MLSTVEVFGIVQVGVWVKFSATTNEVEVVDANNNANDEGVLAAGAVAFDIVDGKEYDSQSRWSKQHKHIIKILKNWKMTDILFYFGGLKIVCIS